MTVRFSPRGIIPNIEQLAIQAATERVILGEANAGAAKTTTLALRVGESIARNVKPEDILVLSFTTEARDVLRERLLTIGVAMDLVERLTIQTLDEFAGGLLTILEGSEPKSILQMHKLRAKACEAIDKAAEQYVGRFEHIDLRKSNSAIADFLNAQLRLKAGMKLTAFVDEGHEEAADLAGETLTDYLVTLAYERLRSGAGDAPDFRGVFDATYDLAVLLETNPQVIETLPSFRVIVCDELHDLNEASFRVLCALLSKRNCFFTGMGDKHQVIHAQLGASKEYLDYRFKTLFPKLQSYPLTHTYRHGPHLALAMRELVKNNADSNLAEYTEIHQIHYANSKEVPSLIVAALKKWQKDHKRLDSCAVLLRDRHQSMAVENALMANGIDYRTPVMGGYLQREEILFLRAMMAIALNNLEVVIEFETRAAMVESLTLFSDVSEFNRLGKAKYDIAKNPFLLRGFFDNYLKNESREQLSELGMAVDYAASISSTAKAGSVLRHICTIVNVEASARKIYVRPADAAIIAKSVEGFIQYADDSGLSLAAFSEAISESERFVKRYREKGVVVLDCVANSKGKEFEHVILPYLEVNEFPNPLYSAETERNLFYVGATRTKRRLTLISPDDGALRSGYIRQMRSNEVAAEADQTLKRNEDSMGAVLSERLYLMKLPFAEHKEARDLGASYDPTRKKWWIARSADRTSFLRWM